MPSATLTPPNYKDLSPARLGGLAFILAELVLVAFLLRRFDLQPAGFRRVFMIMAAGFVVNDLLPIKSRTWFFFFLSVVSMFVVLSGTPETRLPNVTLGLARCVTILGTGFILITICHLSIGFWKRAALLIAIGLIIAGFRSGLVSTDPVGISWIILAGMFMFRLMVYLYDTSASGTRPPAARSLSYFFLPPNVCAPFFPVIDFKKFSTLYYNEEPLVIYQRGARWIVRGLIQLLIYRFVNQLFLLEAANVSDGTQLIQFLVSNLFLYLKVSGSFHMIIGLLLLFGFNLPETNNNYFLADSFTDYWRRVNIYWKDFMMKVFYYPAYFRLKGLGGTWALILATAWTFLVTWAFHLYQTWWLKGAASVTWPDSLFWLILGLLILANSLWEMKRGRKRTLASSVYNLSESGWQALRTAGTFACMCLLWSLWSSPSVPVWLGLWKHADFSTLAGSAIILGLVMVGKIIETAPALRKWTAPMPGKIPGLFFRRGLLEVALPLVILCGLAVPKIQFRLNSAEMQPFFDALTTRDPITAGGTGYYENLTGVDPRDRELAETLALVRVPKTAASDGPNPRQRVNDLRYHELIPNRSFKTWFTELDINRWSMRDRDYELAKPAGTVRIVVLGTSQVIGFGVVQEKVFATIVEDRLNREFSPHHANAHFEVLNFAVPGYSSLAQITLLEKQVAAFKPDIVLFVASWPDPAWLAFYLWRCVHEHIPIPYEYVQGVLKSARVVARTTEKRAIERLGPYEHELTAWSYKKIVEVCHRMGAQPVWTYLPVVQPEEPSDVAEKAAIKLRRFAVDAGFTLVNISNAFDNHPVAELLTHERNDVNAHWNEKGHALIAEELYLQLTTNSSINLKQFNPAKANPPTTVSTIKDSPTGI